MDPIALAMEVLPKGWHFLQKHPGKNIKFYKSILVQEKFARVENIMNKKGAPQLSSIISLSSQVLPAAKTGDIPQLSSNSQITKA